MDWNQIGQALQDLGRDVSGKFKDTADVIKLRQKANAEKQRIRTAYEEIGRIYFKEAEDKEVPEEYQEYFDIIAEASAAIADCKKKIDDMRNTQECPECGEDVDKEAAFCPKCGTKMPEPEPEEEAEDADFDEAAEAFDELEDAEEEAEEFADAADEGADEAKEDAE